MEQGARSNISSSHVIIHFAGLPTNTIKSISIFTGQCGCVWVWRANQRRNADKEKSKAELYQKNRVPIHIRFDLYTNKTPFSFTCGLCCTFWDVPFFIAGADRDVVACTDLPQYLSTKLHVCFLVCSPPPYPPPPPQL